MNYKWISVLLFIIGALGAVIVLLLLSESEKTLLNIISVIGTFASVFGVLIAYLQILSLKSTSESIGKAVSSSTHRLNTLLSVSDLAKSNKLIEEIQLLLQSDKYTASLIRFKDLKEVLIQANYNKDLREFTTTADYKSIIVDTSIDINTLNDYILEVKTKINIAKIIANLENTRTKVIEFENELKYNSHDTK